MFVKQVETSERNGWKHGSEIYTQELIIDERKIDVYFGNGVWNDLDEAKKGQAALEHFLQLRLKRVDVNVTRAFNHTNGERRDLIETFYQLAKQGQISFGYFQTLAKMMTPEIPDVLRSIYLQAMVSEEASDVETMVKSYRENINLGHKVLLVSHSQGNFFGLRAYKQLEDWQKEYFLQLSIATPASIVANDGQWVTDEWDLVIKQMVDIAIIGDNSLIANAYNTESLPDASGHKFIPSYLGGNDTSEKIKTALIWSFDRLENVETQWKTKQSTGCGCESRLEVEHRYDLSLNKYMEGKKVLPFAPSKKLYNIDGVWVKASVEGTEIRDLRAVEFGECYVLLGSNEKISGTLGLSPQSGILSASLAWKNAGIDLDLSVSGPTSGINDIKDIECPNEHWYIASEEDVAEGVYYVSVNRADGNTIDTELLPENISINVNAPDGGVDFILKVEDEGSLNMGAVAKIIVSFKDKKIATNVGTTGAGNYGVISHNPYKNTEGGTRFDYQTIALLNQLKLGPIAGAVFEVSRLIDPSLILYSGTTTSGDNITTNGVMFFPPTLIDSTEDAKLYLITARGGTDVDSNDDFVMDVVPTENLGTIHSIVSGLDIKAMGIKVNVMTEIAYQVLRKSKEENLTKINAVLDSTAKQLFKEDINRDSVINRTDLHSWLPGFDKDKLRFDYAEKIEPIVQKIYKNEDIYLDVYKLLYAGKITSIKIDTNETDTIRISLNNMTNITQLVKEDFILKDSQSNVVDFIFESTNDELIFYPSTELIGGNEYTIEFSIEIIDTYGNIFLDTHLHKFRIPEWIPPIIPETTMHIAENSLFVPIDVIDPSTPLKYTIIGGADKDRFRLNNDEDKLYFKDTPDFEKPIDSNVDNTYELDIRIADSFLNATTQSVQIIVDDVIERPTVKSTYFTIDENASSGTIIGSLELSAIGSPITSIVLSGDGHENFLVDSNGIITVSSMANLDYSMKTKYTLQVRVTNAQGFTDSAEVTIYVTINRPFLLGSYNTSGYATAVAISTDENIACVADFFSGLQIIDISTPGAPILLGNYRTPSSARDVVISKDNNIAYIASYESGLQIIDISKPTSPQLLGSYDTPGNAGNLVLSPDGNVIYMADYASGLQIIDVSTPTAPFLLTNYYTYTARSVTISKDGSTLYLADTYRGLYILDVSTPVSPKLITNYYTDSSLLDIALSPDGNTVYMTGSRGVQIVDVSTPQTPYQLSSFTSDYPRGIVISSDGNTAFVSDNERGLQILDVSNLASPILLWNYDTPGSAQNVAISSDDRTVYISDHIGGLHILDVSYLSY